MNLRSVVSTSSSKRRRRRLLTILSFALVALALMVSLAAPALATHFPDVPSDHQYYDAISDLSSRGIIEGYTTGYFGPEDLVTRQQFAKVITGTGGYPVSESDICPFGDVDIGGPGTFYPDNFVAVCAAKGITVGKTATRFDPYANITRYQVITMVVRAADDLAPGLLAAPSSGYGTWAADPTHGANAARAEYGGLLAGLDLAALSPYGFMNRGEVAQVLHNLLVRLGSPSNHPPVVEAAADMTVTEGSLLELSATFTDADASDTHTAVASIGTSTMDLNVTEPTATEPGRVAEMTRLWGLGARTVTITVTDSNGGVGSDTMVIDVVDWYSSPQVTATVPASGAIGVPFSQNISATFDRDMDPSTIGGISFYMKKSGGSPLLASVTYDKGTRTATLNPLSDLEPWETYEVTLNTLVKDADGTPLTSAVAWSFTTALSGTLPPAGHDLMYFWWSAGTGWDSHNVSVTTGQKLVTPVAYWYAKDDPDIEHLAGMAPNGDLVLFWAREHQNNWQAVNVTSLTSQKIAGRPTAWSQGEPSDYRDNLAALNASGDVIHFWWSKTENWHAANITQISSGPKLNGDLASLTLYDHSAREYVDRVVGRSVDNDLIMFRTAAREGDWKAVNVSSITGEKIAGPVALWWTGSDASPVLLMAARSTSGDLLMFSFASSTGWKVVNVTQTLGGPKIYGPLASWGYDIAGRAAGGDLLHFWLEDGEWNMENLTTLTGWQITGEVSRYWSYSETTNSNSEHLVTTNLSHGMTMFFRASPAHDWMALVPPGGWPDIQLRDGLTSWSNSWLHLQDEETTWDHIAGLKYD